MDRTRTAIIVFVLAAGVAISPAVDAAYVDTIQRTWNQTGPAPAPAASRFVDLRGALDAGNIISDSALDMRFSSLSLLGQPIYDRDGAAMGSLNDILVDAYGNPVTAVISAGAGAAPVAGFVGLNYTDVIDMNAPPSKLTVIKPVSLDMLKNARAQITPPPSGAAASAMRNLSVKTVSGDTVGQVGNFVFGRTTQPYFVMAVGPGGSGGEALMRYKDLQLVSTAAGAYIQLTPGQSDFFMNQLMRPPAISSAVP